MRTEGLAGTVSSASGRLAALKTIVFDCGKVLTRDQDREMAKAMAEILDADFAEFNAAYFAERREYDRGVESARDYWDRVAGLWGRRLDDADLARMVRLDMDSWFTINGESVALAAELKAKGYRILMLSNMNPEGTDRLLGPARYLDGRDWISLFDEVLLSCDLRMMKPDREIYEACLEKTLAPASACLFIDDLEPNVLAARDAGMNAFVFKGVSSLRETLERDYGIG
jgi:putative hydrolase of the HAD superfamily